MDCAAVVDTFHLHVKCELKTSRCSCSVGSSDLVQIVIFYIGSDLELTPFALTMP